MEQEDFPCECGAMVTIALHEREGFSDGTTQMFSSAQCLDCGRRFGYLEVKLILHHQRVLRQKVAEVH